MRFDITRLPVGELIIGFLLAMLAVTFVAAFIAVDSGSEEERELVTGSPTPAASPMETPPAGNVFDIAMIPTIKFDKTELTVAAGAQVTVKFDNRDTGIPHNWAIYTDESASEAIAGANENICTAPCADEVIVPPLEPGDYFFRCDVHPTIMTGTMLVQ